MFLNEVKFVRFKAVLSIQWLLVGILLGPGILETHAGNLQVEGRVWTETVSRSKQKGATVVTNIDPVDFTLLLQPPRWELKVDYSDGSKTHTGFDGTNMATIFYSFDQKTGSMLPQDIAEISTEKQPFDFDWPVHLPWYAWGSGDFFAKSRSSAMPPPWTSPRADVYANIVTNHTTFLGHTNFLPKTAVFRVDAELKSNFKKNPIFEHFRHISKKQETMVNSGLALATNGLIFGDYTVTATTNFHGRDLPLEFEIKQYSFRNQDKVTFRPKGRAAKFTIVDREVAFPSLSKVTQVVDYRFRASTRGLSFVDYGITNSQWLPTNHPVVEAALRKRFNKASSVASMPASKISKFFILGIGVLLAVWPVALWKMKKTRKE